VRTSRSGATRQQSIPHHHYYELPQYPPMLTACHILGERKPAKITRLAVVPVSKYRLIVGNSSRCCAWKDDAAGMDDESGMDDEAGMGDWGGQHRQAGVYNVFISPCLVSSLSLQPILNILVTISPHCSFRPDKILKLMTAYLWFGVPWLTPSSIRMSESPTVTPSRYKRRWARKVSALS